ncbi:MAG TPA: hypothetical protein VFA89_08695 [Terriglobales bacterium]|nr:hypothetical protein [Terriglobales bacterium]
MGWIDKFEKQKASTTSSDSRAEKSFQSSERQKWEELVRGLEQDVKEFSHFTDAADFQRPSEYECRVKNGESKLSVILRADVSAHSIQYTYQSEEARVAAPEGGLLSLRGSDSGSAELYSSDEHLSSEEARRLVLEPLLLSTGEMEQRRTGT